MPAGMELFPAANDTQWNWIKRVIDESDYYLVIVAGRYGSTSKETGLSYTEMEYRYAVERGKPVVGFIVEDARQILAKNTEQVSVNVRKLELFRALVRTRLCKFYSSPADLGAKVSRSITQLKKQHPSPGWVRAEVLDSLASPEEVFALRKANEELRDRLTAYGLEEPKLKATLASGAEKYKIDFIYIREAFNSETNRFKKVSEEWSNTLLSWDEIFSLIGPSLLKEESRYWSPSQPLLPVVESKAAQPLAKKYPNERFKTFRIAPQCIDTLLLQLRALKLIEIDSNKNWILTPYGDNYLVALLGVPKGRASSAS